MEWVNSLELGAVGKEDGVGVDKISEASVIEVKRVCSVCIDKEFKMKSLFVVVGGGNSRGIDCKE